MNDGLLSSGCVGFPHVPKTHTSLRLSLSLSPPFFFVLFSLSHRRQDPASENDRTRETKTAIQINRLTSRPTLCASDTTGKCGLVFARTACLWRCGDSTGGKKILSIWSQPDMSELVEQIWFAYWVRHTAGSMECDKLYMDKLKSLSGKV